MRAVLFRIWIVASMFLAGYIADHYLLVVWFYGFARVYKEGLHFTYSPSFKSMDDYLVSNGDHITKADAFVALPMALIVWAALIAAAYWVGRQRKKVDG